MNNLLPRCAIAALLASSFLPAAEPPMPRFVWWEAEEAAETSFPQPPAFPQSERGRAALSGGAWLAASGGKGELPALRAVYRVDVPQAGAWRLYARKFWKHGPFRFRFDDQPWREVPAEAGLMDSVTLDGAVANWVLAGSGIELGKGSHTLEVELRPGARAAGFDCFVLTDAPFLPRGKLKPGEPYATTAPDGWFVFDPPVDAFGESPIDLRHLNEQVAGERGWIRANAGRFVQGADDAPVRFFAVNAGPEIFTHDNENVEYLLRRLAKAGVNLVRLHGAIYAGVNPVAPNARTIERIQHFVAAAKRQGIYSSLSIYFPLWVKLNHEGPIPGYGKDTIPFALLFFHPEFQKIYRGWQRALLTTPNPHDPERRPLAKDPAVMSVEIVNEDSFFFYTFQPGTNPPPEPTAMLEQQFAEWLRRRHGSLEAAVKAWGGQPEPGDDLAAGRLALPGAIVQLAQRRDLRAQDVAAFLTDQQRDFFAETRRFLKDDLGYGGLVVGSNWVTASPRYLGPLDKYTNTVGDFVDRHGYYSALFKGPRVGYTISEGDLVNDRALLRMEGVNRQVAEDPAHPMNTVNYGDLPSTLSETNQSPPNRYRAEMPMFNAAYGLLQGLDHLCWFALQGLDWDQRLYKRSIQNPLALGQFPAAALAFRRGLVRPGETMVHSTLNVADLKALKGAPVAAAVALDETRARELPAGESASQGAATDSFDPLAFFVGQVRVDFTNGPSRLDVKNLGPFIDRAARVVRSSTGEITWDYQRGRWSLHAPQVSAEAGFLAGNSPLRGGAFALETPMEYGAVTLVSLDGRPLRESRRMLLQVATEDQNTGWITDPKPGKIVAVGGPPLVVRKFAGTVTVEGAEALRVTPLNWNGYPEGAAAAAPEGRFALRPTTPYYLIERP